MNKLNIHPEQKVLFLCFLFLALCFLPSASFGSATWPNEPAGSTKVLDWPFDLAQNGKGAGYMWDVYSSGRIISDATAPLSPSNVFKSSISVGAQSGGVQLEYVIPQTYNELYVGFWWKMNAEFQGRTTANKLFFIRGPSNNGFFGLGGSPGDPTGNIYFGHNSGSLDNSHACSYDLGLYCGPNVGSKLVTKGVWAKIEAYVKKSSTSTSRDGIVRWWVDGVLVGDYTNLNYAAEGLNEWLWSETWDGTVTNPIPSVEWAHFIDHLYISAPNCGSAGCAPQPYLVIDGTPSPARTGTPYSATLTARGGKAPFSWFLASGKLPAGLTLNQNTGVISGSPTCVGRSDFTIRVTDASQPALTATKSYSIITSGTGTCPIAINSSVGVRTEEAQFVAKAVSGKVIFNLPVNSAAQYRVSIYDLTGKQIYEHRSLGQKETSITKVLKNGVYVAKFVQGAQSSALRFQVMN